MLAITTASSLALLPLKLLKNPPGAVNPTHAFPSTSSPTSIAWSTDGTSLFTVSSSNLCHFTASGELLAITPLKNGAENLLTKNTTSLIFSIPGTSKIHVISSTSPEKPAHIIDTHKSPNVITSLTLSNEGTLLGSTTASAVHVHNLTLNSHTVLRGTPAGRITTSAFHRYARTRLLLGVGSQLVVYDTTRPSAPLKVVPITTPKADGMPLGQVVAIACSPFSKTLVGVAMGGGWIALVDLDKERPLLRVLPVHTSLTALSFSPSGASLLAGTENGKLLVIDLRALDKLAGTVCIGEGVTNCDRIVGIAVQTKNVAGAEPAQKPTVTISTTSSTISVGNVGKQESSRQPPTITRKHIDKRSRPVTPPRVKKASAVSTRAKSQVSQAANDESENGKTNLARLRKVVEAVNISDKGKGKGKIENKEKEPLSPLRDLSGNRYAGAEAMNQTDFPIHLECSLKPKDYQETPEVPIASETPTTPTSSVHTTSSSKEPRIRTDDASYARKRTPSSVSRDLESVFSARAKNERDSVRSVSRTESVASDFLRSTVTADPSVERLNLRRLEKDGTAERPDSYNAGPISSAPAKGDTRPFSRAESVRSLALRAGTVESASTSSKGKAGARDGIRAAERHTTSSSASLRSRRHEPPLLSMPYGERESSGARTPSPDLPMPSTLEESFTPMKVHDKDEAHNLRTPTVDFIREQQQKRRKKRVGFTEAHGEKTKDASSDEDDKREEMQLSVVISPARQVPQTRAWPNVPSPLLRSPAEPAVTRGSVDASANQQAGPQNLLRAILSDVLYEFQRSQHSDLVGLHLDLVRMGRGWTTELEGVRRELVELREENRLLREENTRLKRNH